MMLRHKEVRQRLGISYAIIREYVKKGYIKPVLQSGKWRFKGGRGKVDGNCEEEKVVLYGGVSSRKDELAKQVKYLEENVKDHEQVITDVGSSLNVKRRGFLN